MHIKLVTVGKTRVNYWQLAEADFRQRLGRYVRLHEVIIKDAAKRSLTTDDEIREIEAQSILSRIEGETLIAMSEDGQHLKSVDFAGLIERKALHGANKLTFIIGGPRGLSPLITQKAQEVISLSAMTFTHEMAKVVLLEQLYRAFTIIKGEKYHK